MSPAVRGRGRAVTSKAQVAGEVAEAAPLAASLLPSSNGTTSAFPAAPQLPSASQAEGRSPSPPLLGTSHKAQLADRLTGNIEGTVVPPAPLGEGSKRQKDAVERAAEGKAHLEGVAKLANELQPTGSTLSTMQVHTKVGAALPHAHCCMACKLGRALKIVCESNCTWPYSVHFWAFEMMPSVLKFWASYA